MAAEKAEAERLAAEKAEAERLAKEAAEKAEADRLAAEKAEAERLAKEAAPAAPESTSESVAVCHQVWEGFFTNSIESHHHAHYVQAGNFRGFSLGAALRSLPSFQVYFVALTHHG